jgi:glutamate synthase (NADPH/NADH) large chain
MEKALERLCDRAEEAVHGGYNIIILSDRQMAGPHRDPGAAGDLAVHHHLIRKGLRTSVGLVVETGEAARSASFRCLAGYGAEAINPYLAFDTLLDMHMRRRVSAGSRPLRGSQALHQGDRQGHAQGDVQDGHLDLPVLLRRADLRRGRPVESFVDKYFTGTPPRSKASGWMRSPRRPCATACLRQRSGATATSLDVGGEYAFRMRGEEHVMGRPMPWPPAARGARQLPGAYREFAEPWSTNRRTADDAARPVPISHGGETGRTPVPLDEVEPAAISSSGLPPAPCRSARSAARRTPRWRIAMNRIGGKSNTGEGGEEPTASSRCRTAANPDALGHQAGGLGPLRRDHGISGQRRHDPDQGGAGRKARRGRQLPGHKVDATIAKVRHSTPGVGLISPPPHHDIYSIEDLAQLIFDLKNVNPEADISVKLVSEVGCRHGAAGVAKARADHITISGFDGGTGASPLTSLKHAGSPGKSALPKPTRRWC